jgi:glycosyltransferase involved in cell wall biosynthesis
MAGIICQVPVISTFHGFVDANQEDRNFAIKRLIINYGSTKIVFVSNHLKNYYIENMHFSNRKSITIYNGVDTSVFYQNKDDSIRKKFGFGPENIVIGAVGNVRPAKGYDIFIKAARLLYKNHPECRFVVAGHFYGKLFFDLTKLRDELGLEKVFYFIGFQSIPSLVYNNIDIFVSSSNSEGFSISIIEAMACGIPVIATRSGGPEEIISDENNGLLINTGNPEMLSQGISRIIKNSKYREKLISKGLKYVNFNFSLSETRKAYQLMYHNCLS